LERTVHKTKSDRIAQHKKKIINNNQKGRSVSQDYLFKPSVKENKNRPNRNSKNSR